MERRDSALKTQAEPKVFNINNHFMTVADDIDSAIEQYLQWCGPVYLSKWPELELAKTPDEVVDIMGLEITHEIPADYPDRCGIFGGYNW